MLFGSNAYLGPKRSKSNKGNFSFIFSCCIWRQPRPLARWAPERGVPWLAPSWTPRLWSQGIARQKLYPCWLLDQLQPGAHALPGTVLRREPKTEPPHFSLQSRFQKCTKGRPVSHSHRNSSSYLPAPRCIAPPLYFWDRGESNALPSPMPDVSEGLRGQRHLWAYGTPTLTQAIPGTQHSVIFHPTHPCHFLAYFRADLAMSTEGVHLLQDQIVSPGCS